MIAIYECAHSFVQLRERTKRCVDNHGISTFYDELMISSELPEVLGMADRIVVLHEGRVKGEIADVKSATQESIMSLAVK